MEKLKAFWDGIPTGVKIGGAVLIVLALLLTLIVEGDHTLIAQSLND